MFAHPAVPELAGPSAGLGAVAQEAARSSVASANKNWSARLAHASLIDEQVMKMHKKHDSCAVGAPSGYFLANLDSDGSAMDTERATTLLSGHRLTE